MSDRPCSTHPDTYRVGGMCPLCPIPYVPTTPTLREQITEALIEAQTCADTNQPLTADQYATAAMGAIEVRLSELEAKARQDYSGDPWDYGYLRAIKDMRGEQ